MPVAARIQALQQACHQHSSFRRSFVGVGDAQTAAHVDVVDGNARCFHSLDQIQHAVQRVQVGFELGDLGTDVAVNPGHLQAGQRGRVLVGGQCLFMCDAKLVAFQTRGDVGVGTRVHVRIDTQAHRGLAPHGPRHRVQLIQFTQAFHVEATDPGLKGLAHFVAGLADT